MIRCLRNCVYKKPLTLKDAGKLADEYTIVHKAYTTPKPYYRTAMRVEVTNSDKKENKYSGNKIEHKNGTETCKEYARGGQGQIGR